MRCNWWRWLWGIIPLLVLSWVAVQAEHGRIGGGLARARQARADAGRHQLGADEVRGSRRHADGPGAAGGRAAARRATRWRGVWGVRVVDNRAELLLDKAETYTLDR